MTYEDFETDEFDAMIEKATQAALGPIGASTLLDDFDICLIRRLNFDMTCAIRSVLKTALIEKRTIDRFLDSKK